VIKSFVAVAINHHRNNNATNAYCVSTSPDRLSFTEFARSNNNGSVPVNGTITSHPDYINHANSLQFSSSDDDDAPLASMARSNKRKVCGLKSPLTATAAATMLRHI